MRWFTRELYQQYQRDSSEDAWSAALVQYEAHLADLLPHLPKSLRALTTISLHDAHFAMCKIDHRDPSATIRLLGSDHCDTFFAVTIRYHHASIEGASVTELAAWIEDLLTEVLYNELDIDDSGMYQHRYLLWPHGEFAIRFSDARTAVAPASREAFEGMKGHVTYEGAPEPNDLGQH